MQTASKSEQLNDLAAETIKLGRNIAALAHGMALGRDAKDATFVSEWLTQLNERQPFLERDEGRLEALAARLVAEIADEIIEFEQRFVETKFDEFGPHGEVQEVPVYSKRGADLVELQKLFCRFLEARSAVLDHIAAHRALMMLMSG